MPDISATSTNLGIKEGHTIRLIGVTPELQATLEPLPGNVTVTTLASEPANIGIIVVSDEADLRERLFTELNGLISASQVWVLTRAGAEPSEDAIRTEADLVDWEAITAVHLADGWLAVALMKK